MRSAWLLALALLAARAEAVGIRLRADAVAQARAPLGVLIVEADSTITPGFSAEALVWVSGGDLVSPEGDAMVAALTYRDPEGRGRARLGRFIMATGALMPVQMDGAELLLRAGWGGAVELFAGAPVVPRFGERAFDWVAGGRLSQTFDHASLGVAYAQRRNAGQLDDHSLGFDGQLSIAEPLIVAARVAVDLVDVGISEATLISSLQLGTLRAELSMSQRSPARMLPATSLFSVLGDAAARQWLARLRWQLAPRLSVTVEGGPRMFDEDLDVSVATGALLELKDGSLGLTLRREGSAAGGWTGARAAGRLALDEAWSVALEAELVVPDQASRGGVWPWALVAVNYTPSPSWDLAAAIEARAGPSELYAIDGLMRATYRWSEGP